MQFITRAYNKIGLNQARGTITKSSKEQRLGDEIQFYLNLPKKVQIRFPRVVSWNSTSELHQFELEYFPFNNLGKVWFHSKPHELPILFGNAAQTLYSILQEFSNVKYDLIPCRDIAEWKQDMYILKTEREYNALKEKFPEFTQLCQFSELLINGETYKNFEEVWASGLKDFIVKNYCDDSTMLTFMHGDMCFSNILCGFDDNSNAVIKFVDPRGSFGKQGCQGDPYYDLAKLMHSVEGKYEHIIYDQFELKKDVKPNEISFQFFLEKNQEIQDIFDKELFDKFDKLKIRILQGLIYISMCARHYDSMPHQKVMYATGVKILNECLKDIK